MRWTGYPDADLALILIGRIDTIDDHERLDQVEIIVQSMGEKLASLTVPPESMTDDKINEITHAVLGQAPSFEAQSWACKVVRAVFTHQAAALKESTTHEKA